jgi:hypothetical protein
LHIKLLLALPLGPLPPPLSIGRCIGQVIGVLLGHLSSLTCHRKLTIEKDDLSSKALYILTSKG